MTDPYQPKTDALRALYWREEILQVMFWIQGEGFGDAVDLPTLGRFLGIEAAEGLRYVDRLVQDGYLERNGELFGLTDKGRADGARVFADEFAELTKPSHGDCGPDCWCHSSDDEADACAAERTHVGGRT
ncbi:MAG: hypothetical protein HKN91_14070 [Acidimicrobiia bacterium]|nr:hypothetical protein [Acidimicrobiia bacterium]